MRFYVSPESIFPEKNIIHIKDKKEIHHIRDVMRLERSAAIDVFDGQGKVFSGIIEEINKDAVIIKIKDAGPLGYNMPFSVTLYQAIPKKTKMDFIIEKTVELGAARIVPVITDRTIPDAGIGCKKIERWSRIGVAASKQCGRPSLPVISGVLDFNSALKEAKEKDLIIFAALDKTAQPLKLILKDPGPKDIAVFVGPEGDFSPREISMAKSGGAKITSLGNLVLRSETAAIFILSCLVYEYS